MGKQQGTLPSPGHPMMVGHPEQRALGGFPSPTARGDEGTDRQPPTPTLALAWRHPCGAPLTAAPEAALHTPVSPDHPACPKYPPGRKGIPRSPPTGHRVWAGMRRPHTVGLDAGPWGPRTSTGTPAPLGSVQTFPGRGARVSTGILLEQNSRELRGEVCGRGLFVFLSVKFLILVTVLCSHF